MNSVQHRPYFSFVTFMFITMVSLLFILGLTSCSSLPKKELPPNAQPTEELTILERDVDTGYANHYEVLANRDFSKAVKFRNKAREDLTEGKPAEKVLESIAHGGAFVDRARVTADGRRDSVEGILLAREAALSTGVRHSPLVSELEKIDDRVRSVAGDFKNLSSKEFAKLQEDYLDIELMVIEDRELGPTVKMISDAENNGARSIAPNTYREAVKDLNAAENAMQVDRHNASAYARAVKKANLSATMLSDVVGVINQSDRKTDEDAALQIVMQRESIRTLQRNLADVESENSSLNDSIAMKDSQVRKLQSRQELQDAIASIQKDFKNNEADVLQKDDKVVIRLKKLSFGVGSSKIPPKSKALLNKVTVAVSKLNPTEVVVEGHTDASGSNQKNLELSKTRAEAVSLFLEKSNGMPSTIVESVGAGYEKPIATNKTKTGRAQNRRVDVIVTPGMVSF